MILPSPYALFVCCRFLTEDNQAVFTGKQQRDAIAVLPFLVPGLLSFVDQPIVAGALPVTPREPTTDAPELVAANRGDDGNNSDMDYDADDEDAAVNVGKRFTFDWEAYRAVWHNIAYDRAVTLLFTEYASLYSWRPGQLRYCIPPPPTHSRGLSIAEQASRFVALYVDPFLGQMHSMKVHKLMCYIMSAIRWHGDVQSGNTACSESEHKLAKPFYSRTNKHLGDFTGQRFVHARGSHAVL